MPDHITPFEIVPHPIRGTKDAGSERIVLLSAEIRAAEGASDERPIIEITSTSTGEDRHGSTLIEWTDETFMRTGHVLWQHDMIPALPYVGKKLARRQDGDRSISTIELLTSAWRHIEAAHGNLPAFLWETFKVHNMGAISRAFIPLKWKPRRATTIPTEFAENTEYSLVEQTEESFVNVPSNRDSFARAIESRRIAGTFDDRLARIIGYDVEPYVLQKERSMPITPEIFRSRIAETLKRCCGCDSYREPKPEAITDEQKATELALMNELAASFLVTLDVAMRGWKATLPTQRNLYTNIVVDAMYRLEGLIYRAKDWYGADLDIIVPEMDLEELEEMVEGAEMPMGRAAGIPAVLIMPAGANAAEVAAAQERMIVAHRRGEPLVIRDGARVILRGAARVAEASFAIGDRVAVREGADHGDIKAGSQGTVSEIGSPALGITFDDMPDMVHHWYTAEELEAGDDADQERTIDVRRLRVMQQTRVGAELSSKNQSLLRGILSRASETVKTCEAMLGMHDEEVETERFILFANSDPAQSREVGESQTFRVSSASDAPAAGAGDRSKPSDQLYGSDVLTVQLR